MLTLPRSYTKRRAGFKALGNTSDNNENYEYLIAMGNVYRQQQDSAHGHYPCMPVRTRFHKEMSILSKPKLISPGIRDSQLTSNIAVQPGIYRGSDI